MTITPDNAWIYAFLAEISYRRAQTDFALKLENLKEVLPGYDAYEFGNTGDNGLGALNAYLSTLGLSLELNQHQDQANGGEDVFHLWNDLGFSAFVVKGPDGDYIITLRGTDLGAELDGRALGVMAAQSLAANSYDEVIDSNPDHIDRGDIFTNVKLAHGTYTETQYDYLRVLVEYLQQNTGGKSIELTGHSLGGGLAGLAGIEYGLDAHIFGDAPFNNQLRVKAETAAVNSTEWRMAS